MSLGFGPISGGPISDNPPLAAVSLTGRSALSSRGSVTGHLGAALTSQMVQGSAARAAATSRTRLVSLLRQQGEASAAPVRFGNQAVTTRA